MKKYFILSLFFLFGNIHFVFAFNNTIVHPNITREALNLYSRVNGENIISKKQRGYIVKGSIEEDTDPRYLNHFYNPYNKKSLFEAFGKDLPTAKEWAFDQSNFASLSGDYSVGTILENYRNGSKKRAYEGLGHILHLIQDMGVPAHVRVDPHPPWDADGFELATEENARYPKIRSTYSKKEIADIFDEFSKYTIDNFYSDDKIDNKIKIESVKKIEESDGIVYDYGIVSDHIVCRVKKVHERNICFLSEFIYKYYWQEIYPKAVEYSASAIDYFIDEFRKIDNEKKQEVSFWQKTKNILNSGKYLWGDTYNAFTDANALANKGIAYFVGGMGDAVYYSGLAMNVLGNKIFDSSIQIARDGSYATISSVGEASMLGGSALEKLYKIGNKGTGEVLSAFEESSQKINKLSDQVMKEIDDFELKTQKGLDLNKEKEVVKKEEKKDKEPIEDKNLGNTWQARTNILLFSGGAEEESPPERPEEQEASSTENIQNLNLVSFYGFDISTNNREKTSSKDLGVLVDKAGLKNLEFYISESSSGENIIWSSVTPSNFILSDGDGVKDIYLYIRDANSQTSTSTSIELFTSIPTLEVVFGPEYYSSSTEASFVFGANCVPSNFSYSFNDEDFKESELGFSISDGLVFPEGKNVLDIKMRDDFDRVATTSYLWIVDTSAPLVYFSKASSSLEDISLSWAMASSSDIESPLEYFELERYEDSQLIETKIFPSYVSSSSQVSSEKPSFRIRGVDKAGNVGDWDVVAFSLQFSAVNAPVLISEIGLQGKEFVELYNPGEEDLNMLDWYLAYYSKARDWRDPYRILPLGEAEIEAKSFYLLTIKDDSFEHYDKSFGYSSSFLNNSDGALALFSFDPREASSSDIVNIKIDAVAWGDSQFVFEGDPIELNTNAETLERKAFEHSTEESMQSEDIFQGNAFDSNNNNNDFVVIDVPNPQSSLSLAEPREIIVPEEIFDLALLDDSLESNSLSLTWTELENYKINENAFYDLRYFENRTECDFEVSGVEAVVIASSSLPKPRGEEYQESFEVLNLEADTNYCFAIRAYNGEAWSDFSNALMVKTREAQVAELTPIPIVNGYINIDRLTKENSPYLLNYLGKVRETGLVIEAGVIIKFSDYYEMTYKYSTRILAYGPITAVGTREEPIIFTSDKDDSVGGDTNQDGNESSPAPGSWGNIELYSSGSVFENTILKYAGRDNKRGFLSIYEDNNTITNSFFEHNSNGIEIFHASSTNPSIISDNIFIDCGGSISTSTGNGSNPIIENNVFAN